MFNSSRLVGANAYANVGMETGVVAASPHKLIIMLYDGALLATTDALQHMANKNIPKKGKSISHAISIIDNGLRASLDKKVGGEIADNLDALYQYMSQRLIQANLHNNPEYIAEVQKLLRDLKSSWEAIDPDANKITPAPPPRKSSPYDALQPRSVNHIEA
jgi:flagellar protein FliS